MIAQKQPSMGFKVQMAIVVLWELSWTRSVIVQGHHVISWWMDTSIEQTCFTMSAHRARRNPLIHIPDESQITVNTIFYYQSNQLLLRPAASSQPTGVWLQLVCIELNWNEWRKAFLFDMSSWNTIYICADTSQFISNKLNDPVVWHIIDICQSN